MAYVRGNSSPQANLGILNKLIGARHELAQVNLSSYTVPSDSVIILHNLIQSYKLYIPLRLQWMWLDQSCVLYCNLWDIHISSY